MEFASENATLHQRKTELHENCLHRYAELQSRYDFKNIEMIEYKTKANYWESQFHQLKTREEKLIAENAELKAKLRKREQELFGKSSEKNNKTPDNIHKQHRKNLKEIEVNNPEAKATDDVTIATCLLS